MWCQKWGEKEVGALTELLSGFSPCGLLYILNFVPDSFCCKISFMWILPPYLCKDNQFRDLILFLTVELLVFPGVKFLIKKTVIGTE